MGSDNIALLIFDTELTGTNKLRSWKAIRRYERRTGHLIVTDDHHTGTGGHYKESRDHNAGTQPRRAS